MSSGVYQIYCSENDRVYVGSTVDFNRRWREHRCRLVNHTHGNKQLQTDFDLYGKNKFVFSINEVIGEKKDKVKLTKKLWERERYWIDFLDALEPSSGYNIGVDPAAPRLGRYSDKRPTKEWLENVYLTQKKNCYEIANLLECSQKSVFNWLEEYDIPKRSNFDVHMVGKTKPTKEEMNQLYVSEFKSMVEVARVCKVHPCTIRCWLDEYKIPVRNVSTFKLGGKQRPSKNLLSKLYVDSQVSVKEIVAVLGIGQSTVYRCLVGYEIPRRGRVYG